MAIIIKNEEEMKSLGQVVGLLLHGGEIIELVGDVGAGKTTLVKGIARGLDIASDIQSPSFTISRVYSGRDDMTLVHYDFYRLDGSGIMANELKEVMETPKTTAVIEWAGVVEGILPVDRLTVKITAVDENTREVEFKSGGAKSKQLAASLDYDFNTRH